MRFSQRIGKKPIKTEIQITSMDSELRTALWNAFQLFFLDEVRSAYISDTRFETFFKILWSKFFKLTLDSLDDYFPDTCQKIRKWFFESEWFEVYDFIEFVANQDYAIDAPKFRKYCNSVFEGELSGYRFVEDIITEITDEKELKEIEEAIGQSKKTKLTGVQSHLKTALIKLSDRKRPDYRNSVKESISAVESMAQLISQKHKASLGQALEIIEGKIGLHGALKKGFTSIYGYTCDEGGIRHAMLEDSKVEFEDAKYMLVSCSAFINYLIMKSSKAGVEF